VQALCGISVAGSLQASPQVDNPKESNAPSAPSAPAPTDRKQQDPLLQLIRSLTPEQKTRLMESIKTWEQLGPELKAALRARESAIRKSLNEEVHAALEGSSLTKEQREIFEKRYREEKRKLESSLRAEFEARRKASLEELVGSLKKSILEGEPR
jgi:hypothetical protein